MTKTREYLDAELDRGSYWAGVGTIVVYTIVGTIVAMILQLVTF